MFQVNDTVVYGSQGICTVTGTVKQKIGGAVGEYYVLCPIYERNASILVPMHNEQLLQKMRPCLTAEDTEQIIHIMATAEADWVNDDLARKELFGKITSSGDVYAIAQLVANLHHHAVKQKEIGKNLHLADERVQKEAEKMLFEEIAYALQITPKEVLPYLIKRIREESGKN